ncbi:MAG: Fic family protein [Alphaproteobacteria bacterium]|nr:Fic family protein [Alphaproteobacteria bacterium]
MPNFKDIKITPEMLTKISEIDVFNNTWTSGNLHLNKEQLKTMKRVATIESIGSSNRIEGNKMTDAEIETFFKSIKRNSFKSRDEQEVAGYADLLNTIFDNYQNIPLSENYIKQLHQILMRFSNKDERHRGEYKKDSNRVAAFDANGNEIGTVFETATPFDTPRLMRELVEWANDNFKDGYFHPIIVIGVFIVHFLSIHPFTDGNGRMSRALTSLLMLQSGYLYMPYSSMESIIEASKEGYYRALRGTQKSIWTDTVDYEPWLSFFITALQKQKRHLEAKIEQIKKATDDKLSETSWKILDLFDEQDRWTTSDIAQNLGINIETIKKSVQSLVKKGYLDKKGTTRGAWYERK